MNQPRTPRKAMHVRRSRNPLPATSSWQWRCMPCLENEALTSSEWLDGIGFAATAGDAADAARAHTLECRTMHTRLLDDVRAVPGYRPVWARTEDAVSTRLWACNRCDRVVSDQDEHTDQHVQAAEGWARV